MTAPLRCHIHHPLISIQQPASHTFILPYATMTQSLRPPKPSITQYPTLTAHVIPKDALPIPSSTKETRTTSKTKMK